jgi:hypothetical protein
MSELNSYSLSRAWFDFCYENPEKIKPNHTALYFFAIEHCNRLGWKEKFGLPTTMAKEAIGIKSYNTYIDTLRDLVEWKFVKMIEISKNQHSSNIVALSNFNKPLSKALDKALIKHASTHSESTGESIGSIDKPITKNKEQINNIPSEEVFIAYAMEQSNRVGLALDLIKVKLKYNSWIENDWKTGGGVPQKIRSWKSALNNTLVYLKKDVNREDKPFIYEM